MSKTDRKASTTNAPRVIEDTGIYQRLEQSGDTTTAFERLQRDHDPTTWLEDSKARALEVLKRHRVKWSPPQPVTIEGFTIPMHVAFTPAERAVPPPPVGIVRDAITVLDNLHLLAAELQSGHSPDGQGDVAAIVRCAYLAGKFTERLSVRKHEPNAKLGKTHRENQRRRSRKSNGSAEEIEARHTLIRSEWDRLWLAEQEDARSSGRRASKRNADRITAREVGRRLSQTISESLVKSVRLKKTG